jgi:1,4-alpha-glucan branching enzyme
MTPLEGLGRALAEGFAYQGEPSAFRDGAARGTPSAELPPLAFVNFLQNHDQAGNRAFGERLHQLVPAAEALDAAFAVLLLAPSPPLLFMGEEMDAPSPFLFFCDWGPELADAVRDGRRREFARSAGFRDAASLAAIPDPNDPATFERSCVDWGLLDVPEHRRRVEQVRALLALRRREIVPLLPLIRRGGSYRTFADGGLAVVWALEDGRRLRLLANLSALGVEVPGDVIGDAVGALILAHPTGLEDGSGRLPAWRVQWSLVGRGSGASGASDEGDGG